MYIDLKLGNEIVSFSATQNGDELKVQLGEETLLFGLVRRDTKSFALTVDGRRHECFAARDDSRLFLSIDGRTCAVSLIDPEAQSEEMGESASYDIEPPMPGKLVKLLVEEGETVAPGQKLMIVEAMKMENEVMSTVDATVAKINAAPGELVAPGKPVIELAPIEE